MVNKGNISQMFSRISVQYDFLNHLLSLQTDRRWRKILVKKALSEYPMDSNLNILDVCTGTGDLAIDFAEKNERTKIIGIDISPQMLKVARKKTRKITFGIGDCIALPFKTGVFDIVSIGFGLRNLSSYKGGISEMARVLKKGGNLYILEFSFPTSKRLAKIYRFYLTKIVPLIGGLISGDKNAYYYLSCSISKFYSSLRVEKIMEEMGLRNISCYKLTGGIVSIYKGSK